ncbi:Aste57867_9510 [Aphanomyces stellatus]|uniref:Aste57867_9510 protein n=1 Tax=Aphanomyces stellatus TaxID=120398 RepID=A0A485KMZ7_9STRA|nr:hypothetical protein As57867_009473 [Aphanomyces stellatus]VFT86389.1 Aste57867_9510 [Aphanomyces stellatus]
MRIQTLALLTVAASAAAQTNSSADSSSKCASAISATITPFFSPQGIASCSKDIDAAVANQADAFWTDLKNLWNSTKTFVTTGNITEPQKKAVNNSAVCQTWYAGVSTAIKKISPPCTLAVSQTEQIATDKWNATLDTFMDKADKWGLQITKSSANATAPTPAPAAANATSTTKPATTAAQNAVTAVPAASAAPTTTVAKPSHASYVAVGLSTLAVVAVAVF